MGQNYPLVYLREQWRATSIFPAQIPRFLQQVARALSTGFYGVNYRGYDHEQELAGQDDDNSKC